jgi:hypothetical protein
MEMQANAGVVFRYRRPSGSPAPEPSIAMTEALHQLSQAREMEPLIQAGRKAGREVVIEVFHARDGQPLLIHTALLPETV